MDSTQLSPTIELLVDHLRASRPREISLGDVAATTEVLLSTMQRYFASLDMAIYKEFQNLSTHISTAREEIALMRPNDLKEEKIPRAGKELEAIVQSTEEATGTIMDAAEEIMAADSTDAEAYQAAVNDACMRIFEACSFQDITGQRITKVVRTLTYIEDRLSTLQNAWGPDIEDKPAEAPDEDAALLNGPALDGEGIDQGSVDDLLSGAPSPQPAADLEAILNEDVPVDADDDAVSAVAEPELEVEPKTEVPDEVDLKGDDVDIAADAPSIAEPLDGESDDDDGVAVPPEVAKKAETKSSSQADIDALFD